MSRVCAALLSWRMVRILVVLVVAVVAVVVVATVVVDVVARLVGCSCNVRYFRRLTAAVAPLLVVVVVALLVYMFGRYE